MAKNEKISLGEFLQQTRKEKGISIDEIVRDTNISKRYLEALEEDKFEDFPGETYILGFLSTYAEALEIDRELVSSMYRRQMQLEQDAPLEELVGTRKKSLSISPAFIISGIIILSAIVIGVFFSSLKPVDSKQTKQKVIRQSSTMIITPELLTTLPQTPLSEGDILLISNQTRQIQIKISHFTSAKAIDLIINSKTYNRKKGDTLNIDTDNNNMDDMGLEVVSIKNKKVFLSIALITEKTNTITNNTSDTMDLSKYQDVILLEETLFSSSSKQPTDIKLQFKKYGWLEYQADQEKARQIEMKPGASLNISMKDFLSLSLGNAGAATLLINDRVEKGGKLGEVNKSIFYWKNKEGKFLLIRAFLK